MSVSFFFFRVFFSFLSFSLTRKNSLVPLISSHWSHSFLLTRNSCSESRIHAHTHTHIHLAFQSFQYSKCSHLWGSTVTPVFVYECTYLLPRPSVPAKFRKATHNTEVHHQIHSPFILMLPKPSNMKVGRGHVLYTTTAWYTNNRFTITTNAWSPKLVPQFDTPLCTCMSRAFTNMLLFWGERDHAPDKLSANEAQTHTSNN